MSPWCHPEGLSPNGIQLTYLGATLGASLQILRYLTFCPKIHGRSLLGLRVLTPPELIFTRVLTIRNLTLEYSLGFITFYYGLLK